MRNHEQTTDSNPTLRCVGTGDDDPEAAEDLAPRDLGLPEPLACPQVPSRELPRRFYEF